MRLPIALALLLAGTAASAQPAQPDVSKPCKEAPGTPGCQPANTNATPNTGARPPGSVQMQTSPTGMMTDPATQPSPPDPKPGK